MHSQKMQGARLLLSAKRGLPNIVGQTSFDTITYYWASSENPALYLSRICFAACI